MALTRTTTCVTADDGTRLAAHLLDGPAATSSATPLVCLPGGPMLPSDYLGDLGGLAEDRSLALLDPRGTGASDRAAGAGTYRCDRMVDDLEAVRRHLGLDAIDLLAHSAGANLAYRYAERHPDRVARLVLVTPSVHALGIEVPDAARSEVSDLRAGEPWYAEAAAALVAIQRGEATDASWSAITPLTWGRWDEAARELEAEMDAQRDMDLVAAFTADGAFDPEATRTGLGALASPVLVLAGAWDVGCPPRIAAEVAALLPRAHLVVQAGAGHFPWLDDPAAFGRVVSDFLGT